MKRFKLREQLPIIFIILVSSLAVVFDILRFYSSIDIRNWNYIYEALMLATIVVYYFYLRKRSLFAETDIKKILKNFSVLLIALYSFVLINKQFFQQDFSEGAFPFAPDNVSSIFYANRVSMAAVLFFVPMLLFLQNLITAKYKKRTKLYYKIAAGLSAFLMVWTAIFRIAPDINLYFDIPDQDALIALISNTVFILCLVFFFLLSIRNSWITQLRKREKASFFAMSAVQIWLIIYIFDFAFAKAVSAHSLVLGIFTNLAWLFIAFYSVMAGLNLLVHLPTARVFDRKMNEISSLHDLSRAISVDSDFHTIVRLVIEMSSEVLDTPYAWLEVYNQEKKISQVVASTNLSSDEISGLTDSSNQALNEQIYRDKKSEIINEFLKGNPFNTVQQWKKDIESLVGLPIIGSHGEIFGILYAAKTHSFGFDLDDINLLEAYANQASIAFENAELLKKSLERERMEQELQIAREVQLRLLPQTTPDLPELQIETLTITAYEVGGDYYDFYNHSENGLGLIIGDVSGKGTSAAFYMAETKGIILSLANNFESPADILRHTNKILYPSMERKSFISMLAAHWECNSKILRFARAGHCPVIHYSAENKNTTQLQPGGLAIGLDKGPVFDKVLEESSFQTESGDILAFYTDGLSEARNRAGDEFGELRLCELIRENADLHVAELKQVIIDTILEFVGGQALHDDLTLLLLKLN